MITKRWGKRKEEPDIGSQMKRATRDESLDCYFPSSFVNISASFDDFISRREEKNPLYKIRFHVAIKKMCDKRWTELGL